MKTTNDLKTLRTEAKNKIIVALDFDTKEKAINFVRKYINHVGMFKIGLQMFTKYGPDLVKEIKDLGAKVFVDTKLFDIPNTVFNAAKSIVDIGADMFTVHALGGSDMISRAFLGAREQAVKLNKKIPDILGVTVLSSLDNYDLKKIGISTDIDSLVLNLAVLSKISFTSGVVASGNDSKILRHTFGPDFLIVTPGIRPFHSSQNDQKRITTPAEAIKNGSDYLVIGRPITGFIYDIDIKSSIDLITEEIFSALQSQQIKGNIYE